MLPHSDYKVMAFPDRYNNAVGPYYSRLEGDQPLIALLVTPFHVSPRQVCHGAVIAGLADQQSLAGSLMAGRTKGFAATISMTLDFVRPARLGDWLELKTDLLRAARQLLFTQATIRNGEGTIVARSSAIYKFDPVTPGDTDVIARLFGAPA